MNQDIAVESVASLSQNQQLSQGQKTLWKKHLKSQET